MKLFPVGHAVLVEAVLLFCSLSNPGQCIERKFPMDADPSVGPTPFSCVSGGQQQAAAFLDEHPGWRLAKWGCGVVPSEKL
jgi:hypothetical protein